ncbi:hypothetical protein [Phenylobacterium sp.]|uniref:hypothetical protein n=1 Tax=Phenylobacterium sp. TaxID=1871053 RepID=UPI00301D899F
MALSDSALDVDAVARARSLVAPAQRRDSLWPVLAAATALAATSVAFAATMVLAPPVTTEPVAQRAMD